MCVLVLSMWSVSSNISFQVYPLSLQRKKLNKNEIYNCESEVASIQLYFLLFELKFLSIFPYIQ